MTAGEITSILSYLWRSLDPQKKATYKLEEQRRLSIFTSESGSPHTEPEPTDELPMRPPPPPKLSFKSPAELFPDGFRTGMNAFPGIPLFGVMAKP
jgi:hypothetical protein